MTTATSSQTADVTYLARAFEWLALLLARHAQRGRAEPAAGTEPESRSGLLSALFRGRGQHRRTSSVVPPPGQTAVSDEEVARAANALDSVPTEPCPAFLELARRCKLSVFEREVLLLCVGAELRPDIAELCGRAQHDANRCYPTFALATVLFDEPAWEAFAPDRPLRYLRLIEVHQPGAQALITSAIGADERIVSYVLGLNRLDDRLERWVTRVPDPEGDQALPASQEAVVKEVLARWRSAPTAASMPAIQLLGADPPSKELVARHIAHAGGRTLFRLPADSLPTSLADLESLGRLWRRECRLLPLALYIDAHELDGDRPDHGAAAALGPFVARSSGIVFVATREPRPRLGRDNLSFDVAKPTRGEQTAAWTTALGSSQKGLAGELAAQFDLDLATISRIARQVACRPNSTTVRDQAWDACRAAVRPRLDALAERIVPRATLHDIVLPAAPLDLLRQILNQVRYRGVVYGDWGFATRLNRGLGISALFAGDSGTGKTMAAEVLAHQLRLDLYRIDLSAVVSKYIGETEKNLRRLFDAAESGAAILFFDEADALFGRRSEVKDSHDRYANIEIDYLLQRIESYRGLAILATNMKNALDPAFLRRLRFVVDFPFPGPAERLAIWARVLPTPKPQREIEPLRSAKAGEPAIQVIEASMAAVAPAEPDAVTEPRDESEPGGASAHKLRVPVDGLDYERLSRLELTGASILSVAMGAAFLAARDGGPVTMPLIFEALRAEYAKLGRPVNETSFRIRAVGGRHEHSSIDR
jgi:hypothetical protein